MRRTGDRRLRTMLVATAVAAAVGFGLVSPALAQELSSKGDDQIVLTGTLVVPEGQTVATAVIFNGDASIQGTVTGSVVAFNGDVDVSGTVDDSVIAFNGRVAVRSGAHVGGDVASRRAAEIEQGATVDGSVRGITGRFDFQTWGWISRYVWWFGYTISTMILGLALLLFAPGIDPALASAYRRRTGATFGYGALLFFLLPVVAVLLLVIVLAIPLGLFLLLGLGLLYTIGYVAGAHVLGRLVVKPPRSRFAAFFAGWGILRAIALIPVVGGLVFMVTALVGLGALVIAARRTASGTELEAASAAATVPPPPPL